MRDFNEVRSREERRGSVFNPSGARILNHFIDSLGLVDVKFEGYSFTWSHPSATKMSKLDRFLMSDGVISLFSYISAICLDRHLSDHRSILLRDVQVDFGPTPFRFYHSWFCYEGFDEMVEQSWRAFSYSDRNAMIRFKKKLQDLKIIIRQWIKVKRDQLSRSKQNICVELSNIDKELESGTVYDTCLARRCALMGQLHDIKKKEAADSFQKSKAFHNHFASRFKMPTFPGIKINFPFPNRLSLEHATGIERDVSRDEIREAVWNCGDNKSPGSDGYTFEFFKKYWGFIGPDFCEAVDYFFAKGAFSKGCNSSFIALIPKSAFISERQILDGPFIVNELLHWCKRKHEKAMFFKLISLRLMTRPSNEFNFHCGLKQGDPLAPLLFILVMETLHLSISRVVEAGLFKGIRHNSSLSLSHLFYADDALIIGEWSNENLRGIINILKCFFLASGLQINIHKSQLLGVGVSRSAIEAETSTIGCSIMDKQFRYLGIMVGGNTSRHKAWEEVVLKIRSRLSKWKAKTLSIGGRLTLLKSVLGASPLYTMSIFKIPKGVLKKMESLQNNFFIGVDHSDKKITWIAWDKVLASKLKGGLALYGSNINFHSTHITSNWCSILREMHQLKVKGFDFMSLCSKKVGDGNNTNFWFDIWKGDNNLHDTFPRMFALETDKQSTVAAKIAQDRWVCNASGDGSFRVKDIRNLIDDLILPSWPEPTRWVKFIPIKINIFVWRARRDCLPTRWWDLDWLIWSSFANWNDWFSAIKLTTNIKSLLEAAKHNKEEKNLLLIADEMILIFRSNTQI
nr:RNA-directed DNA polymerase, eukaryota [Tanacetum cinerariifolium]